MIKLLIMINRFQNKFLFTYMCVYCVYLLCTHISMYILKKNILYLYIKYIYI